MAYYKLPEGIQDLLPEECYNLNRIREILQKKFEQIGCRLVSAADVEYYDTYAEIKNKIPQNKMFKLTDSDGSLLVLRPDMTLAAARIAATKLKENFTRLSYFSNVWNYQKSGGLYSREISQAGVEFLGVSNAFSDAQAIAFSIECLQAIGIKNFIIDIGHVGYFKGILKESGLSEKESEQVRLSINAKDTVNAAQILKLAHATEKAQQALLALPTLFGGVEILTRAKQYTNSEESLMALNHLQEVYRLLCGFGMEKYISFDLGTVKSLSYYSGIVFTGLTESFGSEILSGGRYDSLADDFGKHIPAVGFAIGLKRVLIVCERQGLFQKLPTGDVVIVCEKSKEIEGYKRYCSYVSQGKKADLFTGTIEEGKAYALQKGCKLEIIGGKIE